MTVEIISQSISRKVWDRAGIKLATLDLQSDSHLLPDMLPTALCGLVYSMIVDQVKVDFKPRFTAGYTYVKKHGRCF